MICSCGCRHSVCEKTMDGHTERCIVCGKVEHYVHDDFNLTTAESCEIFLKITSILAGKHSRNKHVLVEDI